MVDFGWWGLSQSVMSYFLSILSNFQFELTDNSYNIFRYLLGIASGDDKKLKTDKDPTGLGSWYSTILKLSTSFDKKIAKIKIVIFRYFTKMVITISLNDLES